VSLFLESFAALRCLFFHAQAAAAAGYSTAAMTHAGELMPAVTYFS
jgi:hypothetical protein